MSAPAHKLPAFPLIRVQYQSEDEPYHTNALVRHLMAERAACRARMEALAGYATHRPACLTMNNGSNSFACYCGLDALLAACEREKENGDG